MECWRLVLVSVYLFTVASARKIHPKRQHDTHKVKSVNDLLLQPTDCSLCPQAQCPDGTDNGNDLTNSVYEPQCPVCPTNAPPNDQPLRPICTGSSAFTVELSEDKSVGNTGPLTFDRVLSDPCETFTPLLGSFTCPDSATYVFYWTIQSVVGRIAAMLVKDGVDMKYGPVTSEIPGETGGSASMAAIMRCSQGAHVWLRAVAWPDNMACNSILSEYSSFSAFKLFQEGETRPSVCGFTAQMSVNTTSQSTLVFDEEVTDLGDDYDPTTGVFRVPEDGVYVFTVSIHVASSNVDSMSIYVNGNYKASLALHVMNTNSLSTDSGTATVTRVLECRVGDLVTINYIPQQTYLAGVTSFTGYRLFYPDDSEIQREIVAFQASLGDHTEVINGNTIVFDSVSINNGNYYYPAYGIFVCPDSAMYFLTWAITVTDEYLQRAGEARLMMADVVKKVGPQTSRVTLNVPLKKTYTSSTQVIIQCEPTKAFSIQVVISDANKAKLNAGQNSFVGFKIPPV